MMPGRISGNKTKRRKTIFAGEIHAVEREGGR